MKKIILAVIFIINVFCVNLYAETPENINIYEDVLQLESPELVESPEINTDYDNAGDIESQTAKAIVIKVIDIKDENVEFSGGVLSNKYQNVVVKIIEGKYKNKEFEAQYMMNLLPNSKQELKPFNVGDKVIIAYQDVKGEVKNVSVVEPYRINYLIIALILLIIVIISIGGKKGIKTVIAVSATILSVIFIMLPLILKGYSPILASILVGIFVSSVTLFLVGGFNKKSLVAVIGTVSGVVLAGTLAITFSSLARVSGLSSEESQMLLYISDKIKIDISGLFFAGILIGAVGATMDVSMSIASALNELKEKVPDIKSKELINSGMAVGRDTIGTMSNTLILAYVSESLNLILLFMANKVNWLELINMDFLAAEIFKILCGTIGMIMAIPITAITYGLLLNLDIKRKFEN